MLSMSEMRRRGEYPEFGDVVRADSPQDDRILRFAPERHITCEGCAFDDRSTSLDGECPSYRKDTAVSGQLLCDHALPSRKGIWVEVDPLEVDFRRALAEGELL